MFVDFGVHNLAIPKTTHPRCLLRFSVICALLRRICHRVWLGFGVWVLSRFRLLRMFVPSLSRCPSSCAYADSGDQGPWRARLKAEISVSDRQVWQEILKVCTGSRKSCNLSSHQVRQCRIGRNVFQCIHTIYILYVYCSIFGLYTYIYDIQFHILTYIQDHG